MNFWQRLETGCDRWLSAPAVNAAGRMGLYRILYSLFYLWLISYLRFSELGLIPPIRWNPPLLFLGFSPPPGWIFTLAESLLPAALILLLFGYRTRLVTGAVLALGFGLAGMRASLLLKEHTLMLVTFYVPLFMLFSDWGSTYSLDEILRQQRGQWTPSPQNSASHYIWPARGLMAVLAILFVSATVDKLLQGVWVSDPRFVGDLMLEKSVESYLNNGFPVNPFAAAIANNNYLIIPAQYFILLFEAAFVWCFFIPWLVELSCP
ncbi:MAG: hypothetical protein HC890_18775 [Chloroflexaceae bacterium]|nr:hypothetical protein [Chloroflexaceae bacterium]